MGLRVGSRRVGKEPIIKHPLEVFHVSDSSDSGGSGLEDKAKVNPSLRDFVEDNSDSWHGKDDNDDDVVKPGQMGASVMNSNYESEDCTVWWNHHLMMSLGMTMMMMLKMIEVTCGKW